MIRQTRRSDLLWYGFVALLAALPLVPGLIGNSFRAHVDAIRAEREDLRSEATATRGHLTVLRNCSTCGADVAVQTRRLEELDARRREMMGNVLSDAGYEFQMPKGAFYFFPKAPGGDDVAFVNKLLDERILAVPGSGFGGPGHFRLAFCVEDEVIARSAEGFKRARG